MSRTLFFGVMIFVAASAIFGWHIYRALRTGTAKMGGNAYQRLENPARFWTAIAFDVSIFLLIVVGLFPTLRQLLK